MSNIFNCRFLTTVQTVTEADIVPEQLQEQCSEFIDMAKGLLCGYSYLEVLDTYDSLLLHLDAELARKKKDSSQTKSRRLATR